MLNVVGPPPVPAVSSSPGVAISTCAASCRIVRASPTSSETVSPLARSEIKKAAVWTSLARPAMISASAAEVWSAVRCVPAQISSMARLRMSFGISVVAREEIRQQPLSLGSQDRLGVELDALGREPAMADSHDDVSVGRGQLELVGKVRIRDQRVVAAGDQRIREAVVDR